MSNGVTGQFPSRTGLRPGLSEAADRAARVQAAFAGVACGALWRAGEGSEMLLKGPSGVNRDADTVTSGGTNNWPSAQQLAAGMANMVKQPKVAHHALGALAGSWMPRPEVGWVSGGRAG